MKAYIGPYRHRWVSYVHDKYMDKKYGVQWKESSTKFEHLLEKLEDGLQWLYNITINQIIDRRSDQKIKVRVDKHDTWGMDHTLSHIILPMLKQLNDTKHGAPFVGDEDVPEELRSTSALPKKDQYDLDDNHFKRWDWVMDEMIWAFEQKQDDDWESSYYEYEEDPSSMFGLKLVWSDDEGRKAHQARMTNGFKLFGKYYENLWD
jgi:hypothetical protein